MEQIKLSEIIKKLSNKKEFNVTEKRINEKAIRNAKEHGYLTTGQFNCEMRDISLNNLYTDTAKTNGFIKKDNDVNNILSQTTFVDNAVNSFNYPFVDFRNIVWGNPLDSVEIDSVRKLSPKRLSAQINLSNEILNGVTDIDKQLTEMVINAIYQKLIESVFSTNSGDTESPEGILYDVSAQTLSDVEDITNIQLDVDKLSDNGTFICSPTAKQSLNKLNASNKVFDNGKCLNSNIIFTNLIEDKYLCYCDLTKIVIGSFGTIGITVDSYTKKHLGQTSITIDSFFDFTKSNEGFISLGKFE